MIVTTPKNHYSLIIVGSGPAGLSLASELVEKFEKKNILLIESGSEQISSDSQELSEALASGDLPAEHYSGHSIRAFGGSSAVWAGFCSIFEDRSFRQGMWPIKREDLMPYYRQAANILDLSEEAYFKPYIEIPDQPNLIYKPYFLSPPVRFSKKFSAFAFSGKSVDVLMNSTVLHIEKQNGLVTNVVVRGSDGAETKVSADFVVSACGGIGNARLLLLSNINPGGNVGRYFMEHAEGFEIGRVRLSSELVDIANSLKSRRIHAFQLSDEYCLKNNIPSCGLTVSTLNSRLDPLDSGGLSGLRVSIIGEVLPYGENRVTLSQERKDKFSQPLPVMEFNYKDSLDNMKSIWRHFAKDLISYSSGRSTLVRSDFSLQGGGHLMGTTRMGWDSTNSCVDADCRVHGIENLFIAGSSIFPAGAGSNPTYTIVAFSVRLAEHLSAKV